MKFLLSRSRNWKHLDNSYSLISTDITRSKSVKFYLSAAYHGRFCFGGLGILLQSPKIYNKKDIVLITPEKKIDDNEIFTDTRKTCFATNAISVFSFFSFWSISVFDFCVNRQFIWGKNEISELQKLSWCPPTWTRSSCKLARQQKEKIDTKWYETCNPIDAYLNFSFFFCDQSVLWTDVKSACRSNDLPFELKCTFAYAESKSRVIFNSSIFMVHVGLKKKIEWSTHYPRLFIHAARTCSFNIIYSNPQKQFTNQSFY